MFIALPLPTETEMPIDRLCQGLPGTRWLDAAHRHITLRFIGQVQPNVFHEIGESLMRVSGWPIEVTLKGLGHFPPRGDPRVLWIGVENPEPIVALRRSINRVLDDIGIERERENFVPHATIARFSAPPPTERFISWMQRRSLFSLRPFITTQFNLYSSHLTDNGAEYRIEAAYDFVTGGFEQF